MDTKPDSRRRGRAAIILWALACPLFSRRGSVSPWASSTRYVIRVPNPKVAILEGLALQLDTIFSDTTRLSNVLPIINIGRDTHAFDLIGFKRQHLCFLKLKYVWRLTSKSSEFICDLLLEREKSRTNKENLWKLQRIVQILWPAGLYSHVK